MDNAHDEALDAMRRTMAQQRLADGTTAALLMVSGGSDSTALAYLAAELRDAGELAELAMLHVNHQLRGAESDADAAFVAELAEALAIPLFVCEIDIAGEAERTRDNVEAVARRERYLAANEALLSMCEHTGTPRGCGRIFTAHTADDRVESFYMRSIVGTGPGGFRSMRYRNGDVVRPLMDLARDDLRAFIAERAEAAAPSRPVVRDGQGALWREDATNAHTDRFRAYVRHKMVPPAREWNSQLLTVLTRSMNLIAEEDDMLEAMADELIRAQVSWNARSASAAEEGGPANRPVSDLVEGFLLKPAFGREPRPLQRRAVRELLQRMLGTDERIDAATVEAVLDGFGPAGEGGAPNSGYVTNVQGDLAVSANKHGVRVEPMACFRARRGRL